MRKIFWFFGALILVVGVLLAAGYGYLLNGVYATYLQGRTTSNIHDRLYFDQDSVLATAPRPWAEKIDAQRWEPSASLRTALDSIHTGALLVVQRDTVRYEAYFEDVTAESRTNSFSMGKSVVVLLTQIAIQRGEIPGWETPAKRYLPWITGPGADRLTLRHLSEMTADLNWRENYQKPFGITARAYYGHSVEHTMREIEVGNPGAQYEYQSGSTQLLSLCLEAATGRKLTDLAGEYLWSPLGAETNATWHTDGTGEALAYCCLNATARDFARLGQLLLDHGNANGVSVVDSAFLARATVPHALSAFYGQSFWCGQTSNGTPFVYYRGHLGQWIVSVPSKDAVFVRLGHHHGPARGDHPRALIRLLDEWVTR